MAYEDSDYTSVIAVMCWPKHTHLGAGVLWSFHRLPLLKCSLRLSLAVATALKKVPWRFWLHCHDYCRAVTLTCRNSPWWWSYECCNKTLLSF